MPSPGLLHVSPARLGAGDYAGWGRGRAFIPRERRSTHDVHTRAFVKSGKASARRRASHDGDDER